LATAGDFSFGNLKTILITMGNVFITLVQTALKFANMMLKSHFKKVGKKYKVKAATYVSDSEAKVSKTKNKVLDVLYKAPKD
jgi:hypothetical protein